MKSNMTVALGLLHIVLVAGCKPTPQEQASVSGSAACDQRVQVAPGDSTGVVSRFIALGEDSLNYLDFGGEGQTVVFTAGFWPAAVWADFAPRFTDCFRVLAVTDRGIAPSTGELGDVERRGDDILALLDSLQIDRAVLIGNSNPAAVLIYLAEHHPDRLAGLVFLASASDVWMDFAPQDDPSGAAQMIARGAASMQGRDPDAIEESPSIFYLPLYRQEEPADIAVPALTFVNLDGSRGIDRVVAFTEMARSSVDSSGVIPKALIPDSVARTYLTRLATDPVLQAEVKAAYDSLWAPGVRENEQAFFDAFGDHLRKVRIDAPLWGGVPVVQGYEFQSAPELIEGHLRVFLEEVRRGDADRR